MHLASNLLVLALLAAPASEQERVDAARAAFEADDFDTAVRIFESLAHDFPGSARYHYYAGLARENAGQDTHAYVHMRVFLDSGAGSVEERKLAGERAAAIARRTTRVRLQLPVDSKPVTVRVTYRGPKSQVTRPVVVVPLSALPRVDTRPELALEPGTWELTVDPAVAGDERIEPETLEITAGEPTAAVRLKTRKVPRLPVRLDLDRGGLLPRKVTVELRREGSTAPPIVLTTRDAKLYTTLPLGAWTYKATGRRLQPLAGEFSVTQPVRETLRFRPDLDDDERRRRRRLALALLGSGVATAVAGGVLTGVGVAAEDRVLKPDPSSREYTYHFVYANTGLGLLGGTTGLWIAAASSPIRRPRGWIPGLTLGALLTAGSVASFSFEASRLPDDYSKQQPDPNLALDAHPGMLASAFIAGLGAGLLGGATVGLLSTRMSQRSPARASLQITPGPRSSTLNLRLNF